MARKTLQVGRFIVKDDENGSGTTDDEEKVDTPATDTENEPTDAEPATEGDAKTFTEEEVNAIVQRRLAKTKTESEATASLQQELEDVKKEYEQKVKDAVEQGRLESRRETIAKTFGLSVDFVPDTTDADLDKFESELNKSAAKRTVKQLIPVEPKPMYGGGVIGVRA